MSIHRIVVTVDVDDAELAEHDGHRNAPPNEIDDWYSSDLAAALDYGLVTLTQEPVEIVSDEHDEVDASLLKEDQRNARD